MPRHTFAAIALVTGMAVALPAGAQRAQVNGAGFVPNGWCKGNGNPHAAQCPIFAPGSTAPNSYNSHQSAPTTNQLPQPPQQPTLPVITVTPLAPQITTGYSPGPQAVQAPDITGYSPGVVITPNPPQVISGYSPGPQAVQAPDVTGYSPGVVITPNPPQVISGYSPGPQAVQAPDVTGYSPGVVIAPNPPQVVAGFSPGPQEVPTPSFTGYAPYMVPPQPQPQPTPSLKPGYVAYPDYVGPRDPATGYPVVTASPPQVISGYAPYNVASQPALQQTPVPDPGGAQPLQTSNVPRPVEVARPRPLVSQDKQSGLGQATVTVSPQNGGTHVGAELITAKSGRQAPTAVPVFEVKGTGDRWHCVASGHHIRKVFDDNGNEVYAGALPGVAIQVVPIVRDVPAWHDLSSECIISVREHPRARQARR